MSRRGGPPNQPPGPPGLQYPKSITGATPDLLAALKNVFDNLFYIRGQLSIAPTFTPAQLAQLNRIVGGQVNNIISTVTNNIVNGGGADSSLRSIGFHIHGADTADIPTGLIEGSVYIPWNCEIQYVVLMASTAGDVVVDIWAVASAGYPPTNANSITGGNEPELSGADFVNDNALAGLSLAIGDVVRFNIDSTSGINYLDGLVVLRLT